MRALVGPAVPAGAFLQRRQCNQRLGRGGPIRERIKPPGLNARGTPPFRTRADTSDRPKTRWVSALPDSRVRHLRQRTKPLRGGKDPGLVHKPSASPTRPIDSDFAPCLYQRAAPCYSSARLRLAAASDPFFTSRSPGTLPRTRPLPIYPIYILKQMPCPSRLRPPALYPRGRRGLE